MSYRHLPVTKRIGGKIRRYKNLATFNSECSKRRVLGNVCELKNIRCTKDGGGLATVNSYAPAYSTGYSKYTRPGGTWLLHFASCSIMKRHLNGRVNETRAGQLDGRRRRRR